MNVTFDSNVWERVIDEDDCHLAEIKDKIRNGRIQSHICEIALSLEPSKKKLRSEFFENYHLCTTVNNLPPKGETLTMQIGFKPNVELHPGFHPKLWAKILEARNLGFRVLRMTNIGTVRPKDIPDDMYINPTDMDEFWRYAEPLASCSDYITSMGCGQAAYNRFKEEFNLVGLDVQSIPVERRKEFVERWKEFAEAIAEWVDGDSLAAHYAAGNDFFCTDDKAGNAGTKSIFHNVNKNRLEAEYGIKIISSREIAQL